MDSTLDAVGKFSASLVTAPGTTPEDAVRIASALISSAELILEAVGGNALAAQVLYAAADRRASST